MAKILRVSICAYLPAKGQAFDLERNVDEACRMIACSASEGADLVILPEIFAVQDHDDWMDLAEPLDGLVISALSRQAARLGVGIAAGHPTIEEGEKYNSIVLLGRSGEIASVYHKTFPTICELEGGITPGTGAQVSDTEFGRIGFAICYDLNFSELREAYKKLQPDLILFCSAFRGGMQTEWWAFETRSYVVSSCIDPKSVIVNPLGKVVGETDSWTRTATKTLNLDYKVVHYDYTNRRLDETRMRNGREFEFDWAEPEGVMLITATGEKSVTALLQEVGWEDVEIYLSRSRQLRLDALGGKRVE